MIGLLDHIFADLDHIKRDRNSVQAYLNYLDEILSQDLSPDKEVKFSALKVQLEKRLQELELGKTSKESYSHLKYRSGK